MDDTPPGVTADRTKFTMIPEPVLYDEHLTADAVRIYGVLDRMADKVTGWCFASRPLLRKRARMSEDRVTRATEALAQRGYVEKKRPRLGKANEFVLIPRRDGWSGAEDADSGAPETPELPSPERAGPGDNRETENESPSMDSPFGRAVPAPGGAEPTHLGPHLAAVNTLTAALRVRFAEGTDRNPRRQARRAINLVASEVGDEYVGDAVEVLVQLLRERLDAIAAGEADDIDGPGWIVGVAEHIVGNWQRTGRWCRPRPDEEVA